VIASEAGTAVIVDQAGIEVTIDAEAIQEAEITIVMIVVTIGLDAKSTEMVEEW